MRRVAGRMLADHQQFVIGGPLAEVAGTAPHEPNGLVTVTPEGLTVLTGLAYGEVDVVVELHDGPPGDLGSWDEDVELSVRAREGLRFWALLGDRNDDLPDLVFRGPGDYRLRLCARGRDAAAAPRYDPAAPPPPPEVHLVVVWPAPPAAPVVHGRRYAVGAAHRGELPARGEGPTDVIARLLAAVRNDATTPGGTATVTARQLVAARPTIPFTIMAHLGPWLGSGGIGGRAPGPFVCYVADRLFAQGYLAELAAPRRMRFTLAWRDRDRASTFPAAASPVEVTLEPVDDASMVLVEHREAPGGWEDDLRRLWTYYLHRLDGFATGSTPTTLPWP